MDTSHYAKFLSHLSIFEGLGDNEIADIARLFKTIQLKPGDLLCEEGEQGDSFFIIERGSLHVVRSTQQGDNQTIATVNGPTVIGEMALLDGSKRSATVRAFSDVSVYEIQCDDFQVLRNNWNVASYKVIRNLGLTLCQRLRETNLRISDFFENPEKSLQKLQNRQKELWEKRVKDRGGMV